MCFIDNDQIKMSDAERAAGSVFDHRQHRLISWEYNSRFCWPCDAAFNYGRHWYCRKELLERFFFCLNHQVLSVCKKQNSLNVIVPKENIGNCTRNSCFSCTGSQNNKRPRVFRSQMLQDLFDCILLIIPSTDVRVWFFIQQFKATPLDQVL